VVILPDNDEPGIRHACEVAGSLLLHKAQSVRILQLPNLPTSGDVSDYLVHASPEDLFQQIRNTLEWRPTQ
jgi:DNA primase